MCRSMFFMANVEYLKNNNNTCLGISLLSNSVPPDGEEPRRDYTEEQSLVLEGRQTRPRIYKVYGQILPEPYGLVSLYVKNWPCAKGGK